MQAWVALPDERRGDRLRPSPTTRACRAALLRDAAGLKARLSAGEAFGAKAGVPTHSPLYYIHWELAEGTECAPPPGYT